MSQLKFITGSKNKFSEVKNLLGDLEQLDIDLAEIQELDPRKIIKAKLQEAYKHHSGELMVEDTSLYLNCLNGFPGPLIKWFRQSIGNEGIVNLVEKLGDNKAIAKTIIGYAKNADQVEFFEGSVEGRIVSPRVDSDFGWDPIFLPDGYEKTYAEMTQEDKNTMSHRAKAVEGLKNFLSK